MQPWGEVLWPVEDSSREEVRSGKLRRENKASWDFVDNSNPVITAATAAEGDENDFIQRQRNLVGGDVVLDIVCDALAKGLNGEPEQSPLDRDTVPS